MQRGLAEICAHTVDLMTKQEVDMENALWNGKVILASEIAKDYLLEKEIRKASGRKEIFCPDPECHNNILTKNHGKILREFGITILMEILMIPLKNLEGLLSQEKNFHGTICMLILITMIPS